MYFFLKEPNKDKQTIIYLMKYTPIEDNYFKVSTGLKVHPDNWDSQNRMPKVLRGGQGSKNRELSKKLNKHIDFIEKHYRKDITRDELKTAYGDYFSEKKSASTLLEHMQEFIDQRKAGSTKSWIQKYSNTYLKLSLYQDYTNKTLLFRGITQDWLIKYCDFLRELPKDVSNEIKNKYPSFDYDNWGFNDNSLHRHINFLFTFLNWSRGKHHNLPILKNPAKKYLSDKVYLTTDELKAIEDLKGLSKHSEIVRDLFFIGVYSGQRYSDFSMFEKADIIDGFIVKKAQKTKKTSYIFITDKLKALLEKYDYKLPGVARQKLNNKIQLICKQAGINSEIKETVYSGSKKEVLYYEKWEKVSSHTARRTFATLSDQRGMTTKTIAEVMGLSVKTLIETYIKTSRDQIKDEMRKGWG